MKLLRMSGKKVLIATLALGSFGLSIMVLALTSLSLVNALLGGQSLESIIIMLLFYVVVALVLVSYFAAYESVSALVGQNKTSLSAQEVLDEVC